MQRSTKVTLWVVAIMLLSPLLLCGSCFAYWNIVAPTTCRYRMQPAQGTPSHDEPIRTVSFFCKMEGPNDYNESYHLERGPRYPVFVAHRRDPAEQISVTIIDLQVVSSRLGDLPPCSPDALPATLVFDQRSGNDVYTAWQGDLLLDTDPHAGDIITMTFTVEISDESETTRHTLVYVHTPECAKDPYWWMPSA